MKMSYLICAIYASVLIVPYSAVLAAPVYYLNDPVADRNSFHDATTGLSVESFEDAFSADVNLSFSAGGSQGFSIASSGTMYQDSFARLVSDGSSALAFEEYPGITLTFTFDTPIHAFGVDVNDLSFATMSFSDSLGNSFTNALVPDYGSPEGGPGFENLQFFGVTNTEAFSWIQLTFTNTDPDETGVIALDKLEFSTAVVPVPSAVWLFGAGLLWLIGTARSKQST